MNINDKSGLFVCETFETIQGEGRYSGHPCMFIRLMKCRMACTFCDTKFTWKDDVQLPVTANLIELKNEDDIDSFIDIQRYISDSSNHKKRIVISGGEPLISNNLPYLWYMIKKLIENDCHVTIETTTLSDPKMMSVSGRDIINTLYDIQSILEGYGVKNLKDNLLFSISPKFPESCYPYGTFNSDDDYPRLVHDYYGNENFYKSISRIPDIDFYYKFVYHPTFENFILPLIERCSKAINFEIYAMPLTPNQWRDRNQDQYKQNCLNTVEFCKKYNIIYSPRIHTDLWGLATGV